MTRSELTTRLEQIAKNACRRPPDTMSDLRELIDDINSDGVLDVQAPPEIAESMNLPRPAK